MKFLQFLQDHEGKRSRTTSQSDPLEVSKSDRSRHSSGASTTKRRIRANSSSSTNHDIIATKKLRVEVTKLEDEMGSDNSLSGDDDEISQRKKLRSSAVSPSSKKRRSELDKLLDAGLSSFHCESAKQAAARLGPLKVEVSDSNSETGSNSNERLLQEVPDVNQNKSKQQKAKPKSKQTMTEALKKVDGNEVEIELLQYCFERTPIRESWFQTYTRQDQGDEILYYPEHQSFPLPYEMPMSTFCPRKIGKNKSGTATPIQEETEVETPLPTPSRLTRTAKSAKKKVPDPIPDPVPPESILDKLGPRKAAALKEFARKSPRGHASTKSLMNSNSPYLEMDEETFEDLLSANRIPILPPEPIHDECSNDSVFSNHEEIDEIAGKLDAFFTEDDPMLSPVTESTSNKRSRRQSSSSKSKKKVEASQLIDTNIDPMFLDCLEEELPSVTFDEEPPDALDLVANYEKCTNLDREMFKKKRKSKVIERPEPEPEESCHSKDPQSTILRRLLTSDSIKANKKAKTLGPPPAKPKKIPVEADSSSECNSAFETASVASSTTVRRRKRNMTGFPSPKKKKKNSEKVAKKTPITPQLTKKPQNNKKAKSVQLQLKVNKNGLSLQKPTKVLKKVNGKNQKKVENVKPIRRYRTLDIDHIPSSEDDDDIDDDDDHTFRPRSKGAPVKKKKKKKSKKKRPLNVKPKKPLLPPPVITIEDPPVEIENEEESSDEDHDESEHEEDLETSEDEAQSADDEEDDDEDKPIRVSNKLKQKPLRKLRKRRT